MNENEQLQMLATELKRTVDIIEYLEHELMRKRAWKRTTEFRIAKLRTSDKTGEET